jgi:putative NIF3 family GTP cyclohydrolase 1 type 2
MTHIRLQLTDIAQYLDELFEIAHIPDDADGVIRASERPIARLGLVLQPWEGIGHWAHSAAIDALFIHRPWRLDLSLLPPDIGIIAYHRAFDEHLTLSYNPWLADELGMTAVEVLGTKEGRPIGMIAMASEHMLAAWPEQLRAIFEGLDEVRLATKPRGTRIAVVGAMNDALVREVAARGASVYVTGQWRVPAASAVADTGIGVAIIGHRRSEEWGLRMLGHILKQQWSSLEIVL